ncbi:hypothetical protein [Streptomyces sp. NPDC102490]
MQIAVIGFWTKAADVRAAAEGDVRTGMDVNPAPRHAGRPS